MKKSTSVLFVAICVIGLVTGAASRRMTGSHAASGTASAGSGPAAQARSADADLLIQSSSRSAGKPLPELAVPKSSDTVETLLSADPNGLYGRLAVWMASASEDDIAAYWEGYRGKDRSNDITDLVFISWSRKNPQAAIAAVAGTKDEHYAWWAWASHDPAKSMAAAIAANQDRVNNVMWGLGEFNPQWLRDHIDELPKAGMSNAMRGMAKWSDSQNPLESLNFLKKHGAGFDSETFKNLVRQDPWEAQDWLKQNLSSAGNEYYESGKSPMEILISTLGSEHPEDLERMASQMPSGAMKRKMEDAVFEQLLLTDPAAAAEKARKVDAPIIAADRIARVGLSVLKTNPEEAFGMYEEILNSSSGKLNFETRVEYPNGSTMWGEQQSKLKELQSALLAKDPARTLDLAAVRLEKKAGDAQGFHDIANQWSTQDLVGFTEWVNKQSAPAARESGGQIVSGQLAQQGNYEEAIEWLQSTSSQPANNYYNVLYQWRRTDPTAAMEWLDSAEMPAADKDRYKQWLKQNSN